MFTKKTYRTKAQLKTSVGLLAEIYDIMTELAVFIANYCFWFGILFLTGLLYYGIIKLAMMLVGVGI